MDINLIVNITSRTWSLPILAMLHEGVPGRQAPLLNATGAGRTAFAQSMTQLIELGLVVRNPGYGHPLRPEFRLTPTGLEAAGIASRILKITQKTDQNLIRRAWTIPILSTLQHPQQFSGIRKRLITITDRSLSLSLKNLEERKWVSRTISETSRPPRAIYQAINAGHDIGQQVSNLAQ